MGLGYSSLTDGSKLKNAANAAAFLSKKTEVGQVRDEYLITEDLYDTAEQGAKEAANALNAVNDKIDFQLDLAQDLLESEGDVKDPYNSTYDVTQFLLETSQGMCGMGMGMGMGSFEGGIKIQMTGQELIALSTLLSDKNSGVDFGNWDKIAEKLQESGIDAKVVDNIEVKDGQDKTYTSKGIEITRKDGTKTTVCDANGNGGLDVADYDFTNALAEFDKNLDTYNAKIKEIEDQVDAVYKTVEGLKSERETAISAFKEFCNDENKLNGKLEKISDGITNLEEAMQSIISGDSEEVAKTTDETITNYATAKDAKLAEFPEKKAAS